MLVIMHPVQPVEDLGVGENFIAGKFHVADLVLAAFVHVVLDVHRVGVRALQLDVLDFKIQETVVAVIIREQVAVGVKVILLEITGAGQPGKRPAPPDFEFRTELAGFETGGAEELDVLDLDLRAFLDVEDDDAVAGQFLDVQDVLHLGVREPVFLVQLLDVLDVGEHFLLIQRVADLEGDLFLELGIA